MVIFHSYVKLPEGISHLKLGGHHQQWTDFTMVRGPQKNPTYGFLTPDTPEVEMSTRKFLEHIGWFLLGFNDIYSNDH